jgi:hypothetical protein
MILRSCERRLVTSAPQVSSLTKDSEYLLEKERKMRVRILVSLLAVFALLTVAYAASNIDGTWKGQRPGRDGNMMDVTFKFKAEGSTLTGSTMMRDNEVQISDGKISGSEISFVVKMEFGGNSFVMRYTGTISGNEIKMKSQREGSDRTTEFTLKKS